MGSTVVAIFAKYNLPQLVRCVSRYPVFDSIDKKQKTKKLTKNACLPVSDCKLSEGRDCDLFTFASSVAGTVPRAHRH